MALADDFQSAVERAPKLPKRPPSDILLQFYALFKQASVGDMEGVRPGFADFEGRAKYDAWSKLQGKAQEEAMQEYIALIERIEQEQNT